RAALARAAGGRLSGRVGRSSVRVGWREDGLAEAYLYLGRADAPGTPGPYLVRPVERDRKDREFQFRGKNGGAFFEFVQVPVKRTLALRVYVQYLSRLKAY